MSEINGATKKDLIYYYLIHGYYAQEIKDFKDISVTKSYLSQVIKSFLKSGYIELIDMYPKRYQKGATPYPRKLSDLTKGSLHSPLEQPRIHLNIVKFEIEKSGNRPKTEVKDHIIVDSRIINNTEYIDIKCFVDIGRIVFRICNNKTLLIFTPGFFSDPLNYRHNKQLLLQKTEKYANWFTKKYGYKLGERKLCLDSDIAVGERDPYLLEMNQKYGMIKLVDQKGDVISWWDSSKGYFEFETKKEDIAEIKSFMPLIVENLQNRVYYLQQETFAHGMCIDGINSTLDKIVEDINKIKKIIEKNTKKKPFNNESYTYI